MSLSPLMRMVFGLWFALVGLFLVFPLLMLVPISVSPTQFLRFPPEGFSLRWYATFFIERSWVESTWLSIQIGAAATVLSLGFGTAAALAIVRGNFPGRRLLYGLMIAPLIVPAVILALGLFLVLAKAKLLESMPALIAAHTVIALPYVVLIVAAALRNLDQTLERAARVMGASPLGAFRHVTMPAIAPALFAGGLFAFFASFDELVITYFISGAIETLPLRIWNDLNLRLDPTVAAVACLLILVSVVGMGGAEWLRRRTLPSQE